jgi:hypothetical protein
MMADRLSTEEFALQNMTRSLGRQEQGEQQRAMARAVPDDVVRSIVADFRSYDPSPGKASPGSTVRVSGAGTVVDGGDKSGWVEPRPLRASGGDGWAYMTTEEIAERNRQEKARKSSGSS